MALWQVSVFLLTVVAATVLAEPDVTFIENLNEPESRIVSGWETAEGQIPHQLSLRMVNRNGGVTSCGGTVLSPYWGLTAAHCTAATVTVVIRAGVVNLTLPSYIFETTNYYNHPLYNEQFPSVVQPHDIGVVEFGRPLTLSDVIQPIRLQNSADMNRNYAGDVLTASGWGRTWTSGSSPENMNWVFLRGVSNLRCWSTFGGSSIIVDSTICAEYYNVTSQSTCQGDSGGPLTIVDDDGDLTQVGVTSFVSGMGCHAGVPAGFIRPGHYHSWFTEVTGENYDWAAITTEAPTSTTDDPTTVTEGTTTVTY